MSSFSSILTLQDGSDAAARALACAAWLAGRLDAELHVLSVGSRPRPARDVLSGLRVPEDVRRSLTLHQAAGPPDRALLDTLSRCEARLVVLPASATARAPVDAVARAVVEAADAPVLLFPPDYVGAFPWDRALVPVSGEAEADVALPIAAALAHELGLELLVAHVVVPGGAAGLAGRSHYVDAPQHEIPRQLSEILEQASSTCTPATRRHLRELVLRHGDVGDALVSLVRERGVDLVVAGWHGSMARGRAGVIQRLLREPSCVTLLVRAEPARPFRLQVGAAIG